MDEPQFVCGCVPWFDLPHLSEATALLEMRHDGAQAVGALGMAGQLGFEVEAVIDLADASRHSATHRIRHERRLLESGRDDNQLAFVAPFGVPRIVIFLLQGRGTSFFSPARPRGKLGDTPRTPGLAAPMSMTA